MAQAQANDVKKIVSPNVLLIRVGNLCELLDVFGDRFHLAINDAVLERLLECGFPPSTIILGSEFVLVNLGLSTQQLLESIQQQSAFCCRVAAVVAREPVNYNQGRSYLRVLTELYSIPCSGVLSENYVRGALLSSQQRETRALRLDMLAGSALLDELRAGRLVLAFQPIELLKKDGETYLYSEALLRRFSPSDGRVYSWPNAIEALERNGWIIRLDCSVIWTVVRLLERYSDQRIGCNVSAVSFSNGLWWSPLISYLEMHRSIATRLTLEITETSSIINSEDALAIVRELRSYGVQIALDDMGAGYSTLEFLSKVRPDVVKVDRSILLRSREPQFSPDLLRNLAKVCADYSSCVVVEGIESEFELQTARYSGAKGVQGYLIGKPSTQPVWLLEDQQVLVVDAYKQDATIAPSHLDTLPKCDGLKSKDCCEGSRNSEVVGAMSWDITPTDTLLPDNRTRGSR